MGPLHFDDMCVVANVVDEILLGEDLLLCDSSGHANIVQSKEKIMFTGATIMFKMVRPSLVRCVTAAESARCLLWKRS